MQEVVRHIILVQMTFYLRQMAWDNILTVRSQVHTYRSPIFSRNQRSLHHKQKTTHTTHRHVDVALYHP